MVRRIAIIRGSFHGVVVKRPILGQTSGGAVNPRDQLAFYVKKLTRRLRLGALLRGTALLISAALTATIVLVLLCNAVAFSDGSLRWSRLVLFLVLAGAAGFGLAAPFFTLNRKRAVRRAESAFPQFDQRLLTFTERDQGSRDPFIDLLAADTLAVASAAQPAYLVPDGKLLAWLATGRRHSPFWFG